MDHKVAGELIFDARPDVTYWVRPSKQIAPEIYEHLLEGNTEKTYSGTFTATFSAYEPFGFLTKKSYSVDEDANHYSSFCGMLRDDEMPSTPNAASRSFLVYNCGTEPCGVRFSFNGTAPNGFTIINETNRSVCKILGLPQSPTQLIVDGDNCQVLMNSDTSTEAFELHDDGYVYLTPYEEVYRDVTATWAAKANIIYINSDQIVPSKALINKFIYINGNWHKIIDCLNDGGLVLMTRFSSAGSASAIITTMNEIVIEGEDLSLTDMSLTYAPRVL